MAWSLDEEGKKKKNRHQMMMKQQEDTSEIKRYERGRSKQEERSPETDLSLHYSIFNILYLWQEETSQETKRFQTCISHLSFFSSSFNFFS